jgi:hypothetical protein
VAEKKASAGASTSTNGGWSSAVAAPPPPCRSSEAAQQNAQNARRTNRPCWRMGTVIRVRACSLWTGPNSQLNERAES